MLCGQLTSYGGERSLAFICMAKSHWTVSEWLKWPYKEVTHSQQRCQAGLKPLTHNCLSQNLRGISHPEAALHPRNAVITLTSSRAVSCQLSELAATQQANLLVFSWWVLSCGMRTFRPCLELSIQTWPWCCRLEKYAGSRSYNKKYVTFKACLA